MFKVALMIFVLLDDGAYSIERRTYDTLQECHRAKIETVLLLSRSYRVDQIWLTCTEDHTA